MYALPVGTDSLVSESLGLNEEAAVFLRSLSVANGVCGRAAAAVEEAWAANSKRKIRGDHARSSARCINS